MPQEHLMHTVELYKLYAKVLCEILPNHCKEPVCNTVK